MPNTSRFHSLTVPSERPERVPTTPTAQPLVTRAARQVLSLVVLVISACSGQVSGKHPGAGDPAGTSPPPSGGSGAATGTLPAGPVGQASGSANGSGVSGGASNGVASGAGAAAGVGTGGPGQTGSGAPLDCAPVAPRRLVRLTLSQTVSSIRALLGSAAADPLVSSFGIGDVGARSFPPLSAPEEGTFVTEAVWNKSEGIGQAAAAYVFTNYATVTGCPLAATTDTCAQTFIGTFAEKAFRRPLEATESDSLMQVYTEAKSFGASVPEAAQTTVEAVLTSPNFLYRPELGSAPVASGAPPTALSPYEAASQLAFFLTDGPPDAALLDAAKLGKLGTSTGVAAEADRLLGLPAVQANLQQAMFSYFGIANLGSVVIDPAKVPVYTVGVQNAMLHETNDFLTNVLWKGKVDDLLLSRQTEVNPDLAGLYGIPFPAGVTPNAATFVPVQLPETRAGLLTQLGFLTSRARPDAGSVVARGLVVASTILCADTPAAPPTTLSDQIAAATTMLADKTEREKSLYRQTTPPCSACHTTFDPYGLVLENFDLIGRYRTADDQGRPIDSSATLPADVGGGQTTNAVDFAQRVTANGVFASCVARNLMKFALADGNVERGDCAVQAVTQRTLAADKTFATMLREIAASQTLAMRVNP